MDKDELEYFKVYFGSACAKIAKAYKRDDAELTLDREEIKALMQGLKILHEKEKS